MKSDQPFQKAFSCSMAFAVIGALGFSIATLSSFPAWLGTSLVYGLGAGLIGGTWCYFSKESWSWVRMGRRVFFIELVHVALVAATSTPVGGPIDRKTYSLSLPSGWKEETSKHQDDGNGNTVDVFRNVGNTMATTVLLHPKTENFDPVAVLSAATDSMEKKFGDPKRIEEFTAWGRYQGKGGQLEGTFEKVRYRARTFVFESGTQACVIAEFIKISDYEKSAADLEQIRQSFRLK